MLGDEVGVAMALGTESKEFNRASGHSAGFLGGLLPLITRPSLTNKIYRVPTSPGQGHFLGPCLLTRIHDGLQNSRLVQVTGTCAGDVP